MEDRMKRRLMGVWLMLLFAPLVPVVILYFIFDQANYFKLEDAARGIVATGPIAAYVALVLVGVTVYRRLFNIAQVSSSALKQVKGQWTFVTTSAHETERAGRCTIDTVGGQLTVTGTFVQAGEPVGDWHSVMARLTDSELTVVYDLSEIRGGKAKGSQGLLTLYFDSKSVSPMKGRWVAVGESGAHGTITFSKVR
jgi:hypothetical protein